MTDTALNAHNNVARGIAAVLGGVFLFSIADMLGKWFGMAGYHTTQIVFFRYLFGLIPVTVVIWHNGFSALRTRRPMAHVARGMMAFVALSLLFRGLRDVPLAEGIAVAFSAPLFVTALSGPVLGERVGIQRWAAVLAGFVGMLVMLRPGSEAFRFDTLYIMASAVCFAAVMLFTRRLARSETNASMYAISTVTAGLCTVPFLTVTWVAPQGVHLGLFMLLGIVGGTASFLMIIGYRNSPASVNAPFDYVALIWSVLWGWLIWQESPDAMVIAGAGIVVASGLFIGYRETARQRRDAVVVKAPYR